MELHSNMRAVRAIAPQTAGTTGTGRVGKVINRQGYGGVEFVLDYGSVTATNATFTVIVKEGDVTGTMTSVADTDLIGTEALASLLGAATRTSDVSKNVSKRIGYKGTKQYVNVTVVNTVTAAAVIAASCLLYKAQLMPVANP